jgi:hypothetical protein
MLLAGLEVHPVAGRITATGPPRRWQRPTPSVTQMAWPKGCVCHAVRAPGVMWTLAAAVRDGGVGGARVSRRPALVNMRGRPPAEGSRGSAS